MIDRNLLAIWLPKEIKHFLYIFDLYRELVYKMSSHHKNYKDSTSDLKHDLKRKRRELEEMEERFKREETESKRLKGENADLWKLYYGLQQELQTAYERNAKLTVEKMNVEGNYEKERHEHERLKQEVSNNVNNAATLKDALCSMQSEKMALQQKFNDLVVENKRLKDREREIEPKLREVNEMKKKLDEWQKSFDESQNKLILQTRDISCHFLKVEERKTVLKIDNLESDRSSANENLQTLASKCRILNDELKSTKSSLQRELESIKVEPWIKFKYFVDRNLFLQFLTKATMALNGGAEIFLVDLRKMRNGRCDKNLLFKSTDICESLGKIIVHLIKNAVIKKNSILAPLSTAHFSSSANQNGVENSEKPQNSASSSYTPPSGLLLFNDSTISAVTVDETMGDYVVDDDDVQIIAASTSLPDDDDDNDSDEQQIIMVTSSNENDNDDTNNNNDITIIDFVGGEENNTTLDESAKISESNDNTEESLDAIGDVDSTSKYVQPRSNDQKLINKNNEDDEEIDSLKLGQHSL
uniref:Uncharacterized protein n=1 Tax=Romanomermis culicivorax TaxID=13658 RepID=A0A915IF02_ROMCU